jgi:hypothetical protein
MRRFYSRKIPVNFRKLHGAKIYGNFRKTGAFAIYANYQPGAYANARCHWDEATTVQYLGMSRLLRVPRHVC